MARTSNWRWVGWSYSSITSNAIELEETEHVKPEASPEAQRESENGFEPTGNHTNFFHGRRYSVLAIVLTTIAVGTLVAAFIHIFSIGTTSGHDPTLDPVALCGNSTAEALELGCEFDQLMWAWFPPGCPHYANSEFLQVFPWKFYLDPRGEHVAVGENWTKALDSQIQIYGTRAEHLTHCVFLFLSLGQAMRDQTPYTPMLNNYDHLHHCSQRILEILRKDVHWEDIDTLVPAVDLHQWC